LAVLIGNLPKTVEHPSETLVNYARMPDKFYIPTRYPNGFESGAPSEFYTSTEAQSAIDQAEAILEFCRNQIG
jgi:HEPN domain-containing protein